MNTNYNSYLDIYLYHLSIVLLQVVSTARKGAMSVLLIAGSTVPSSVPATYDG